MLRGARRGIVIGLLALHGAALAAPQVQIGVLENGGREATLGRWQPTARYLTRTVPDHAFDFVPFNAEELRAAIAKKRVDFVLTDAGFFIDLERDELLVPIATRRTFQNGVASASFGALLLTRAERTDIGGLQDLRGKSLVATHDPLGSFHLVWRELARRDIRPFRDLSSVSLRDNAPEDAVYAVRDRIADAGAVPTGVFERLVATGRIDPRQFRLLNTHPPTADYPLARSTPLYPDWVLATLSGTSPHLTEIVAGALLAMKSDDPAARSGQYAGWAPPLSLAPVHALHRELHLRPYEDKGALEFVQRHWPLVLFGALALLALTTLAAYALRANRKLALEVRTRAAAQEQLQTYASALQQTTDAVMITDPNGVIEYVNPAFTRLTGYDAREACGATPRLLRSGEHDSAFYARLWETIRGGQVFHDELVNRRKDGSLYWEQKSIIPLRDASGRVVHFIATGRDVTAERRAEEEVELRREQLAHTARVNFIGEMAAGIAHEISQPLTAIINYAQGSIRRLRTGEIDNARLLAVLEQIVGQSQRAADAIVTLRRFVARRKPTRTRVDINSLVAQVVALAGAETRKRGIVVKLELASDLPHPFVDDIQIEQVIFNLLRNGAEALASADGIARELTVRTEPREENSIEISVSDTGPGLPPRLAAKLFEPFFSTKPDGVGLGLAVSRTIIETHGGRIWVTPNPERGVTFRFTLPVEAHTHER